MDPVALGTLIGAAVGGGLVLLGSWGFLWLDEKPYRRRGKHLGEEPIALSSIIFHTPFKVTPSLRNESEDATLPLDLR